MKKEIYIVEIEMPDGDTASSMYIRDVIQSDCDVEDEGRWKVSVKEFWKPSDEQIEVLDMVLTNESMDDNIARILRELRGQLKKLTE